MVKRTNNIYIQKCHNLAKTSEQSDAEENYANNDRVSSNFIEKIRANLQALIEQITSLTQLLSQRIQYISAKTNPMANSCTHRPQTGPALNRETGALRSLSVNHTFLFKKGGKTCEFKTKKTFRSWNFPGNPLHVQFNFSITTNSSQSPGIKISLSELNKNRAKRMGVSAIIAV